jgi:NADPH:quinone reductase-like Zn-dependent oxidoreductase
VLDSSDANFEQRLRSLARELKTTAVFEAIAGESTGVVLGCLPDFAHVYLFGALSEESCSRIGPINLIFGRKSISGFYLPHWVQKRGTLHVLRSALAVQKMLINGEIETVVHRRLTLDETGVGLQQYADEMTTGKMLIMPHKTSQQSNNGKD